MPAEPDKYQNGMFKIHSGAHPLGEQARHATESRIAASCLTREGAKWSKEEIISVIYAFPPLTNDEIALSLQRGAGSVHLIKCFVRKAILKPETYLTPKIRNSRLGIRWRIADILLEQGVVTWPDELKLKVAQLLPGTTNTKSRAAKYLAKNT